MKKRCKECHKTFTVGVNGLSNGLCDTCQGIQRDNTGYFWHPWETSQTYQDCETGAVSTTTRDEAFGRKP